jgi:uncharacterized protein (TIGR00106 family)
MEEVFMLAEFSIVPLGTGESLSALIAEAVRIVKKSGLPHRLTPMGTVVEGDWDEVMAIIRSSHEKILEQAPRAVTSIKIDDRKGKTGAIDSKVRSVEDRLRQSGY